MNRRQEELFRQLCAGIDVPKWTPKKRETIADQTPTSLETKNPRHEMDDERALEQSSIIRKTHRIKVSTPHSSPAPIESFEELENDRLQGLSAFTCSQGFSRPTPIQMQAIPTLIAGRDVVGVAPTGSGKTLAFLIPILSKLDPSEWIQAVVISPTCELSSQTFEVFINLELQLRKDESPSIKAFLLEKSTKKKLKSKRPNVLFTTPFALLKQIKIDAIDLTKLKFVVFDEADRLLSTENANREISDRRNYVAQIDSIVIECDKSEELVKAMFSATFPPQVSDLANNILLDPLYITVGQKNSVVESVEQRLIYTGGEQGKLLALRQILKTDLTPPIVVFVDTKDRVDRLMSELRFDGLNVESLHSDIDVAKRNRVLTRFRSGVICILITTDLISRGIDFRDLNVVINFDFPKSTIDYIHRIGRTGRAGLQGKSFTFFTDLDKGHLRPIANIIKQAGGEVPDWMTSLQRQKWKRKRGYGEIGVDRDL